MNVGLLTTRPRRLAVARRSTLAATLAVATSALMPMAPAHADSVLVVNSVLDTTQCTATACTLRGAILAANGKPDHAVITFNIPGPGPFTIAPAGILPMLRNPAGITIDGYTQPGASVNTDDAASRPVLKINVKGPGTTTTIEGLKLGSSFNTIRGLALYNWRHAILADGSYSTTGEVGSNTIVGDFICTDSTGTFRAPNLDGGAAGIIFQHGAHDSAIGAPTPADRNVISGCAHRGVTMSFDGTTSNKVQNNIVGLAPDGSRGLGNRSHGLDVNYSANDNLIGGTAPYEHNVVSGNDNEGIEVSHGSGNRRNRVIGNYVGTDLTGLAAPAYASNGQATTTVSGYGIRLEGEKECNPCAPNAGFIEVANNIVVNNKTGGILIDKGQQWNWVHDNLIGVLPDGTPAGNQSYGLRFEHSALNNTIGPGNTIAYNARGVQMQANGSQPPSSLKLDTPWNRLTRNSIFSNGGAALGIDLAPYGQANVNGVGDTLVNHGIQAPTITGSTTSTVSGTACGGCLIEVFQADTTSTRTLTGFGEPKNYLGSVTAGSGGAWSLSGTFTGGQVVTATATALSGNVAPSGVPSGATQSGDTSEAAGNKQVV